MKWFYNLLAIVCSNILFSQAQKNELRWQIGVQASSDQWPTKWYPSTVPGAIQLDFMVGEKYKQPYWFGNNFEQFTWMEQRFFTYKATFAKPKTAPTERVFFHSKGIDYQFDIFLNGEKIHYQEGMFTYVDIDITARLKEQNEIKIRLYPVPTVTGSRNTIWHYRDNARYSAKPAVSYGWDWHPRLITRGIWDETYIYTKSASVFANPQVTYTLQNNLTTAQLKAFVHTDTPCEDCMYLWEITDPNGKKVFEKKGPVSNLPVTASLNQIQLWWPNGYGPQNLYTYSLTLLQNGSILDKKQAHIGFRQTKLIMSEGGWIEPQMFPKSRSVAPATLEINGKRIFAKGSNWVHPEIFMGLAHAATYEKHIKLAKEANFNIFRVWGGGVTNKESFFDLCDKYGIMVWQEFPLACNQYPDDSSYLSVLAQEATSIVNRGRQHPSVVLWCGGNELFNEWSKMTEQSLPLRLLNKICYELDPNTPFIYTSPLFGMGHGHYVFWELKNGGEVFQWMPRSNNTAYTEFGVPGVANIDVLKSMMPSSEWFPPKLGTAWETHHAFNVWGKNRWLELPFLEEYFGPLSSLEDLVAYSQLTQCEGYKCIFEEARRQKPYCGMAINWCYQEPWPCAANNSLINWPSNPKPAYYHVTKSCRPKMASARVPKFRWEQGETFTCDLFILNDTFDKLEPCKVSVKLVYDDTREIKFLTWDFAGSTEENVNIQGPTARVVLPDMKNNLFKLVVEVEGKPEWKSEYTFIYRGDRVKNTKPKIKYLNGVEE